MIKSIFKCPECKQECSKDIDKVFEHFGKDLHNCHECDALFVVQHSAQVSTEVFTINSVTNK